MGSHILRLASCLLLAVALAGCVIVPDQRHYAGGVVMVAPPPELCTDNGAMIAWAGAERLALGLTDTLDTPPRARWPLSEVTAVPTPAASDARRAAP